MSTLHEADCNVQDLPHVVLSYDPDDPTDIVVWRLLANHAEYLDAEPALLEYAEETEGVEQLVVQVSGFMTGAVMAESIRTDIAELAIDDLDEGGDNAQG